jgi:hypothetical protein
MQAEATTLEAKTKAKATTLAAKAPRGQIFEDLALAARVMALNLVLASRVVALKVQPLALRFSP